MKKVTKILLLLTVVSLFSVTASMAQQVVVRVRPARPKEVVVERPTRPTHRHVWVAEEWTPAGGRYAYHTGHWAVPPRPRAVWIAGHWAHRGHGYVWVAGRWR